MKKPISIYIHIPFCIKRCSYCDFLTFAGNDEFHLPYIKSLCEDIKRASVDFAEYEVATIFFGGGTPTCLKAEELAGILRIVFANYSIMPDGVITTEANPETVDFEYLAKLRAAGFNRLSFGVQSFDDSQLELIGRLHSGQRAIEAVYAAEKAGFLNINIDLMFSLPNQTIDGFGKNLDMAVSLPIMHISTYSLIVEESTPLSKNQKLLNALPTDELDRQMYQLAKQKLRQAGFVHYEISNFAKNGYICGHNIAYWTRMPYIGFGVGAHSFIGNRFCRTDSIEKYIQGNHAPILIEELSHADAMSEFVILGLRLIEGISTTNFSHQFGCDIFSVFGDRLKKAEASGLLEIDKHRIRLTDRGIDISNTVFLEFI